MKLRSKLLVALAAFGFAGTVLAQTEEKSFDFFGLQRMITDGYRFMTGQAPTKAQTQPPAKPNPQQPATHDLQTKAESQPKNESPQR